MAASAEEVRSFTRQPEPRSCRESSPEKNSENSLQRLRTGFGLEPAQAHAMDIRRRCGRQALCRRVTFLTPPHCLGRAPGPLSPPTITNLCRRDLSHRYLPIGAEWTETALWLVLVEGVQSWVNRAFDPRHYPPTKCFLAPRRTVTCCSTKKSRSLSERLVKTW